ncbi:MAG TPA: hypothetical protein VLE70_12760, partial [Anaerolineae bacterium]|nr:hypothetical protein [Anaerolineae bacterium]
VAASYEEGDFVVSGFWPDWQNSGAAGMPAVVNAASGDGYVTLIGVDPSFRGHPENMFRLLGNAIFTGVE